MVFDSAVNSFSSAENKTSVSYDTPAVRNIGVNALSVKIL
jgi:hypothetical protein